MAAASRVGLVFSSGFFGFFAHAGFLCAIREMGIVPAAYAGASSGAIVAAMAASGMSDEAVKTMLFNVKKKSFWHPDPWTYILKRALRLFRGYTGYLNVTGFGQLLRQLPVNRIEECEKPLVITAANLTDRRETVFYEGNLIKCIQASGAVPVLFKPVHIDGALYVDGGVVNKAPLKALSDRIDMDKIIVHFMASGNLSQKPDSFLRKKMTPWHIQSLAINIARQEAYRRQLEMVRLQGIEVIEVETGAPASGPNKLHKGPEAYEWAKTATMKNLRAVNRES